VSAIYFCQTELVWAPLAATVGQEKNCKLDLQSCLHGRCRPCSVQRPSHSDNNSVNKKIANTITTAQKHSNWIYFVLHVTAWSYKQINQNITNVFWDSSKLLYRILLQIMMITMMVNKFVEHIIIGPQTRYQSTKQVPSDVERTSNRVGTCKPSSPACTWFSDGLEATKP